MSPGQVSALTRSSVAGRHSYHAAYAQSVKAQIFYEPCGNWFAYLPEFIAEFFKRCNQLLVFVISVTKIWIQMTKFSPWGRNENCTHCEFNNAMKHLDNRLKLMKIHLSFLHLKELATIEYLFTFSSSSYIFVQMAIVLSLYHNCPSISLCRHATHFKAIACQCPALSLIELNCFALSDC